MVLTDTCIEPGLETTGHPWLLQLSLADLLRNQSSSGVGVDNDGDWLITWPLIMLFLIFG